MSRLRFAAPDAGFLPLRAWDTREYCVSFSLSKRWTVRAAYIRYVTAEAHRTVRFFIMWMSVDKWIRCGLPTGLELSNVGLWGYFLPPEAQSNRNKLWRRLLGLLGRPV